MDNDKIIDTWKKDNLMVSLHSDKETEKIAGMYIRIEPFTEEDVAELLRLLHKLLHRKNNQ